MAKVLQFPETYFVDSPLGKKTLRRISGKVCTICGIMLILGVVWYYLLIVPGVLLLDIGMMLRPRTATVIPMPVRKNKSIRLA